MATKSTSEQSTPEPNLPPPVKMAQKQASLLVDQAKQFVTANGRSTKARATLGANAKALGASLGRLVPKLDAASAEMGDTTKAPTALSDAAKKTKSAARKALTSAGTTARQATDAHQAYRALEPLVASITAELDRAAMASRSLKAGQRVRTPDAPPKRAAWQPAERAQPAKNQPAKNQPAKSQRAKNQPAKRQSASARAAGTTPEAATKLVAKAQKTASRASAAADKLIAAINDATKAGAGAQKAVAAVTNKLPAAMKAASAPQPKPASYVSPRAVAALDVAAKAATKALEAADRAQAKLERQLTTLDNALVGLDEALPAALRATAAVARTAGRPAPAKPAAKKPAAKQPAKKPTAEKPPAKKTAAKQPVKKPAADKPAAKQPTTKRTPKVHLTSTGVVIDGKVPRFDRKYLNKQKNKLLKMQSDLTDSVKNLERDDEEIRLSHELGDTQFSEESGEGDSSSVEHDNIKYISALEQDNLIEIQRALERIKDGTYGYSLQSGLPIPIVRLDAMPEATLRVDEKSTGGAWN